MCKEVGVSGVVFLIIIRNLGEDNIMMGSSDMVKRTDTMGLIFNYIGSDLYKIMKDIGPWSPTGYE